LFYNVKIIQFKNIAYFDRVAVFLPLNNPSSLLHTYFSKGLYPDCEKWYKCDLNLHVEFVHWGLLFGTDIWLVSNVLKPKILVMTCQQPLVKQARVVCS